MAVESIVPVKFVKLNNLAITPTRQKIGELVTEKEVDVLFEGIDFNIYRKVDFIHESIHEIMNKVNNKFYKITLQLNLKNISDIGKKHLNRH